MPETLTAIESAKRPTVQLSGTDGNVYCVIGNVSEALRKAGFRDHSAEFKRRAFNAGDYDAVFLIASEYVNIK